MNNKLFLIMFGLFVVFGVTSCLKDDRVSQDELSYRHASLDNDANVVLKDNNYSTAYAGTSKKIKRAFQDAPPMIPHNTDGMLPISKGNNQCIMCHVDTAPYDKTIPAVPQSHMTSFRSNKSFALEKINTSSEELKDVRIKKMSTLYKGRFNCTQCHAPQSNAKLVVKNNFKAQFTKKDGEFKSSWSDKEYLNNINTFKK